MVEATAAMVDRHPIEIWEAALSLWALQHKMGDTDARLKRLKAQRQALVKRGPQKQQADSENVVSTLFSALAEAEKERQPARLVSDKSSGPATEQDDDNNLVPKGKKMDVVA